MYAIIFKLPVRTMSFLVTAQCQVTFKQPRQLLIIKPWLSTTGSHSYRNQCTHTHTPHTSLTALCPGLPRWAGTREVKPIWILLKQETVSGSGIRWAICNSAPRSRQITMPAPHCSVFYRLDALPATQPTASRHWRCKSQCMINKYQIYPRLICFTNKWQRWLAAQYYFQEMIQ